MPDVSEIRKQVETRLKEIERLIEPLHSEYEQLKKAAAAFEAEARSRIRSARPSSSRGRTRRATSGSAGPSRGRGRPRGSGGRAKQAVELVSRNPGLTIPEMAKRMGIGPNYLYRVLPQLEKDGKVKKQGKGYHPA